MNLKEIKASKIPDDMTLLHKLLANDYLVKTPSQDYDDSYCIQYTKNLNAFIITNDKFRDYIDAISEKVLGTSEAQPKEKSKKGGKKSNSPILDKQDIKKEQQWIRSHSVSYSFNKDEFLPNPDSGIWQKCKYDEYRNYTLDLIWGSQSFFSNPEIWLKFEELKN